MSRINEMNEQPAVEELQTWHRRFAVEANNRAWSLAEKPDLTGQEKTELLDAAHAAAYHWRTIGTAGEVAHADLLLGRVHAILGNGAWALKFAKAAFDFLNSHESQPWELAFAHAIMADASFASENAQLHAQHYEQARALGESLTGEDKDLFLATFNRIPVLGSSGGNS